MPTGLHHSDLHVWLWKANPNGMMHPTNLNAHCPPGPYTFHEEGPKKVHH